MGGEEGGRGAHGRGERDLSGRQDISNWGQQHYPELVVGLRTMRMYDSTCLQHCGGVGSKVYIREWRKACYAVY